MVEQVNRPTLVMAPNKTLAAQLYAELKDLFPDNAVEYFVSYYDYYQPEAYLPATDTYIEKDSSVNDEIDKLRHSATHALLTRRDVIVVASVSAIYGLGAPETYGSMHAYVETGMSLPRDRFLRRLVDMLYARNDVDFHRGTFRVRGDVVEVFPQYEAERALRIEFFGDEVESIAEIDPLRGKVVARPKRAMLYPASHYVGTEQTLARARSRASAEELQERLAALRGQSKLLEAQRLEQRTLYDLEMLEQMGFCHGVENYSRWLDGRGPGETPYTLFDYFPDDLLVVMDESHISVPQIGGDVPRRPRPQGDAGRVRLPPAVGARQPAAALRGVGGSARRSASTSRRRPGAYELEKSGGVVVEQIIRPTGLTDPKVEVRPAGGQVDDLLSEIRARVAARERVLVTTLTKRMAEELTEYYAELGREGPLPAQRREDARAHGHPARAARGRLRRAGRDQPAARGARPAGGVAGRGARRGQGGLPALDALADPDDRTRGAQRERRGDPLRRPRDGLDPRDARRDRTGAASCRRAGTASTASRRRRCRSASRACASRSGSATT